MALFTLTTFLSALLLFLVQPMFAKLVLPYLGGTPAVWNTCLVFYQAALLVGYAYAHFTTHWLRARRQAAVHLVVLLVPIAVLPIAIPAGWRPPLEGNPVPEVLWLLTISVGLPFLAVSATAPLLQAWYAASGRPGADNPYSLYAASNLGSMGALLAYPFLVEPSLRLTDQSWLWSVGYGLLAALIAGCAVLLWRSPAAVAAPDTAEPDLPPTTAQRFRWLCLAAVPSSLLQGVTTFVTTDLASTPLLWIVPLALYLLTFVLAFAGRPLVSRQVALTVQAPALILLCLALCVNVGGMALSAAHLGGFFYSVLACQTELAASKPAPRRLTEFYLWMSLGGLMGGVLSAIVAPLIFNGIYEYPLAVIAACLLRPRMAEQGPKDLAWDFLFPAVVLALVAGTALAVRPEVAGEAWSRTAIQATAVAFLLGAAGAALTAARPLRLALTVAALLMASMLTRVNEVVDQQRSFFGVLRVLRTSNGSLMFVHGTTVHGIQSQDPAWRRQPVAYYHRKGPLGDLFTALAPKLEHAQIGVCGLGIGGLSAYGQPGQTWTFYEIDPVVEPMARQHFSYLADCPAKIDIRLGDARLSLLTEQDRRFKLLMLDAFSSDAVPTHLLSLEALDLYLDKLADDGVLVFHISNRCLDLTPVLGNLAAERGLYAIQRSQPDAPPGVDESDGLWAATHWVVMARRPEHLGGLAENLEWKRLEPDPTRSLWADDRSNLFEVIRWRLN